MNRIKELRKIYNISQRKLAEIVNVTQTSVSQWETGKTYPDIEMLGCLADTFRVSVDCILGRVPIDANYSSSLLMVAEKPGIKIYGDNSKVMENFESLNSEGQARLLGYCDRLLTQEEYTKLAPGK